MSFSGAKNVHTFASRLNAFQANALQISSFSVFFIVYLIEIMQLASVSPILVLLWVLTRFLSAKECMLPASRLNAF